MRWTVPVPIPSDLATFKIQPPSHDRVDQKNLPRSRVVNYQLSMMWHSCIVSSRGSGGRHGAGAAMSTEQVEYTFAFTVGFAITGCWSLISGMVVVLALATFGISAG